MDGPIVMALDAAAQGIQDQSKTRVFISYSREDRTFADRLDAALEVRAAHGTTASLSHQLGAPGTVLWSPV
jgi:hypothetical protein